jgi:hypothetical protein
MDNTTNEAIGTVHITVQPQLRNRNRPEEAIAPVTIDPVTKARSSHNREAMSAELEATRTAFLALVDATSDERWQRKSLTTRWTEGQMLVHLTWALEQLPREVASARQEIGMFNYPKRIADPLSYWYTRWIARNATRESIAQRYDAAITAVIKALNEVQDNDWERGARFYGERFYTVAELFQTPAHHLAHHTVGL